MYIYNFEAFTSPCELQIDATSKVFADDVAHIIYLNAKRLEKEYSFFSNTSQLYPINNRTDNTFEVNDELASFIELSLFYNDATKGAFDIALAGTLKEASLASSINEYNKAKETLLPYASSSHMSLCGNELSFSNTLTKIDLGGIVKEYAVDASMQMLERAGITSALVNFGGDIAVCGTYDLSAWNIGIQNPKNLEENLCEIELNDNSLCTSGHSKRFYEIEKERKSHIISKENTHYSQISITAPTTVDAGIWSTALLVDPKLTPPPHIRVVHSI